MSPLRQRANDRPRAPTLSALLSPISPRKRRKSGSSGTDQERNKRKKDPWVGTRAAHTRAARTRLEAPIRQWPGRSSPPLVSHDTTESRHFCRRHSGFRWRAPRCLPAPPPLGAHMDVFSAVAGGPIMSGHPRRRRAPEAKAKDRERAGAGAICPPEARKRRPLHGGW